jgi:hypothetical protein
MRIISCCICCGLSFRRSRISITRGLTAFIFAIERYAVALSQ